MDQKTLHIILLVIGISLGAIVSAYGEAPAPFFKKNVAKCFYCADEATIEDGLKTSDKNEITKAQNNTTQVALVGVDPKSPLPFQELVKAYESGNVNDTYKAAKAWVQYQDRILKRTSDLAALVNKAKQEVEAEAMLVSTEIDSQQLAPPSLGNTSLKLAFFFDTTNPSTEAAAINVQDYYQTTLADPTIEVFGIPAFINSVEDLRAFKSNTEISFPVQYNRDLENEFDATGQPLLLAFIEGKKEPCRLEGSITPESIGKLVSDCKFSQNFMKGAR
jgi:hypothetical protein